MQSAGEGDSRLREPRRLAGLFTRSDNGTMHLFRDSEGRIVRGLLAVLLTAVEKRRRVVGSLPLLFDELAYARSA